MIIPVGTASPSIALALRKCMLLIAGLALLALPACAGPVQHGFEFGSEYENQDVEILNWRYGDSKLAFTHPANWELESGKGLSGGNATGIFPVADFFYAKWRVKSTGKVYEDTVDLKSRLPFDMNNKTIHFAIKGPQLYVYLIQDEISAEGWHTKDEKDCPIRVYKDLKCSELYPNHWSNF